jgi:hypothetical protein
MARSKNEQQLQLLNYLQTTRKTQKWLGFHNWLQQSKPSIKYQGLKI